MDPGTIHGIYRGPAGTQQSKFAEIRDSSVPLLSLLYACFAMYAGKYIFVPMSQHLCYWHINSLQIIFKEARYRPQALH